MSETNLATRDTSEELHGSESLVVYFLLGIYLGVIFIKSEVASWFRIQEMFFFDAFHMYGVIGGAVGIGALSVFMMKRTSMRTVRGDHIVFPEVEETRPAKNHAYGGLAFGVGWGLLGACPGPIYALIGSGISVMLVGFLAALVGAWTYGLLRPRLPH